jgi:hypothetical protein
MAFACLWNAGISSRMMALDGRGAFNGSRALVPVSVALRFSVTREASA